jgi:hypothetical protein
VPMIREIELLVGPVSPSPVATKITEDKSGGGSAVKWSWQFS